MLKHRQFSLLLISGISLAISFSGDSQVSPTPTAISPQLAARIRQARERGDKLVLLPETNVFGASVHNLQEALDNLVVIVGTLESKPCNILGDRLQTWAVFRIDEDLSRYPISTTVAQTSPALQTILPPGVTPIDTKHLVVHELGGSLNIDGVELKGGELVNKLKVGERYVLVVSSLATKDNDPHVGYLSLGSQGIFHLAPNGYTLEPVVTVAGSPLQHELHIDLTDDLDRLRERASKR